MCVYDSGNMSPLTYDLVLPPTASELGFQHKEFGRVPQAHNQISRFSHSRFFMQVLVGAQDSKALSWGHQMSKSTFLCLK